MQSEVQANFAGALKHRENAHGVINLLITCPKCNGEQEKELKNRENHNASLSGVWESRLMYSSLHITSVPYRMRPSSVISTCRPCKTVEKISGAI